MKTILVTGANGQLGTAFKDIASDRQNNFIFTDVNELNLLQSESDLENYIISNHIDIIINCAAYTNVDKAETDYDLCRDLNEKVPEKLANISKRNGILLIHISTDYVFGDIYNKPINEWGSCSPINNYGYTKRIGELKIEQSGCDYLIFRTSWLYYKGQFKNFVNTILNRKDDMNIVFDQVGSPTYAGDLALAILDIIDQKLYKNNSGIYHYSNEGVCSWYDFAMEIKDLAKLNFNIKPILSSEFKTPANRPKYSVMDKSKFKSTFGLEVPYWKTTLKNMIKI
jgi:dTDP-4-dehydrorhamnose reductase